MTAIDTIVTLLVLFGIFIIVYSRVKNQSLTETIDDIKGIFSRKEVE